MYESVVTTYVDNMVHQIEKDREDQLMVSIKQAVGYDINKEELIKALQYDRDQYNKGYSDAMKTMALIPVKDSLPEKDGDYLVTVKLTLYEDSRYVDCLYFTNKKWYDVDGDGQDVDLTNEVTAWCNLPQEYIE